MKRNLFFLFLLAFMTIATVLQAQAPQAVTLQSVLRDAAGRLVSNRNVSVLISLRRGSNTGTVVYSETHTPTTNQNGLYTVFFGRGTAVTGTFASIDWAQGPYYATVEADPNGGSNYTLTVSHPIVSVPYALYAEQTNEQQALSLSNDTIYLTGGGATRSFVKLPALGGGGPSGCVPSCGKVDTIRHQLDSIINLSCLATVHYVTQSACDSFTWPVNAQKYLVSGTYTYTRARGNHKGCDSIEMLMLTINQSSHNVENQKVTGFMTWHGTSYATSGTYTYGPYNNSYNCPSVDTLKLTVNTAGSLPGEFSVSATKKIRFSRGNLQHQASSGKWRFAEHQYDCIMDNYGNINMGSGNTDFHDLFGWGTSGYQILADALNYHYRPWENTTATTGNGYNTYGYGPSTNMIDKNLTGASDLNDWGIPNAISNGGLQTGKWRTLTAAEWKYLLVTRPTNRGRFCHAQILHIKRLRGNGDVANADFTQNGIIILPDNFEYPAGVSALTNMDNVNWGYYTDNPISLDGWSALEAAGAVFLPAAGFREVNTVYAPNSYGRYWSSTYSDATYCYSLFFHNQWPSRGHLMPDFTTISEGTWSRWPDDSSDWGSRFEHARWNSRRCYGFSVRLVQDIN